MQRRLKNILRKFYPNQTKCDNILARYGGLAKRIDEHRELMETLLDECPDVLGKHSWGIKQWLVRQDVFLCGLKSLVEFREGWQCFHVRACPVERLFGDGRDRWESKYYMDNPLWKHQEHDIPSQG